MNLGSVLSLFGVAVGVTILRRKFDILQCMSGFELSHTNCLSQDLRGRWSGVVVVRLEPVSQRLAIVEKGMLVRGELLYIITLSMCVMGSRDELPRRVLQVLADSAVRPAVTYTLGRQAVLGGHR